MAISIAVARKNTILATYGALFNSGTLKIFAGAVPANADASQVGQTLLGTMTFGSTAFASPVSGSMTANAITQDSAADATGTAAYYRAYDSGGTVIEQGTVGTQGSGAELIINTTSIVIGGPIVVTSFERHFS